VNGALGQVTASLGVSRATAYACLQIVRAETVATASAGGTPLSVRPGRQRAVSR
jgi:hypothetical protein